MSMEYIRKYYGVPAKRGGRIRYTYGGNMIEGSILSARGGSLHILLDGNRNPGWFHPTWQLEYL